MGSVAVASALCRGTRASSWRIRLFSHHERCLTAVGNQVDKTFSSQRAIQRARDSSVATADRGPRPRRKPNAAGEWRCCRCGGYKAQSAFNMRPPPSAYLRSVCKDCDALYRYEYRCTLRGFTTTILARSRYRAHQRGLAHTLTLDELLTKLLNQETRCFYSGMYLNYTQPNSHWRMSLERIDNLGGYTSDNCVFIAAEFNTSDYSVGKSVRSPVYGTAQWSRHKFQQVPILRETVVDFEKLGMVVQDARGSDRRCGRGGAPRMANLPDPYGNLMCSTCLSYNPADSFYHRAKNSTRIQGVCKACHQERGLAWRRTLRGNVLTTMSNASYRSRTRSQAYSLTLDGLLDQLLMQRGRCYYSGVPLELSIPHSDWRMSLERLSNDHGYTLENCVWVANEFNTPDYSRNKAKFEIYGTAQWSKEKVEMAWGPVAS